MSECKHSFNLSYGKYCKICGLSIVDAWNLDVSDLEKERDELQAQVVLLRECIEMIKDKHINPLVNHKKYPSTTAMCLNALAATPSDAAERAKAIEQKLADARGQVAVLSGCLYRVRDEINNYGSQANLAWLLESAKEALSATPSEAAERVNALVRALEKLARLGGPGGGYGNSDGNVIAQRALAAWRKHE
nr:hypothetical protein [uncultured Anaeromusa sp.]